MRKKLRWTGLYLTVVACGCLGLVFQAGSRAQDEAPQERAAIAAPRQIAGFVESANTVSLHSQVPGTARIISIVAEGTQVKKGDLLIRLDSRAIEEQIAEQRIQLATLMAENAKSKAALSAVEVQSGLEENHAELSLKAALLAREKELGKGGEIDLEIKAVESAIAVAEQRIIVATKLKELSEKRLAAGNAASQENVFRAAIAEIEAKAALNSGAREEGTSAETGSPPSRSGPGCETAIGRGGSCPCTVETQILNCGGEGRSDSTSTEN